MIGHMKNIILSLLLLFPFIACAAPDKEWTKFDVEFDDEKPWVELQSQLPAYPAEGDYLPFYVSAATPNQFYIDQKSISIGEDAVVRYTLIVKSPGGALNISFEGIRCATGERKLYAFGRSDGSWSKARNSKWEAIAYKDRNRYHHVLHDDFFCKGSTPVQSAEVAVNALKSAPHPN